MTGRREIPKTSPAAPARAGVASIVERLGNQQARGEDGGTKRAEILALCGAHDLARPITDDDLWTIRRHAAVRFHTSFFREAVSDDEDLIPAVVEFACAEWMRAGFSGTLCWPSAGLGTAEFASNLTRQMSAKATNPQAAAYSALSLLSAELAMAGLPDAAPARAAFFAGMAFGQIGEARAERLSGLLLNELERAHQKKAEAQDKRLRTMAANRAPEDAALFELACSMLAADPKTSNAAIQRVWRKREGLPLATESNAQSVQIGRWRRMGMFDHLIP